MSKKIRSRFSQLLVAVVLLAALITNTPATQLVMSATATTAQQPQPKAAANAKSAAVIAATAEVLRETSEIRRLEILQPVRSGAQSRSEIERMIIKNLDEESTPEELRASELALKKLGLAPANFQMRPFLIKLLTEQVAEYYDPKSREFRLADWMDVEGQRPVMAHELVHALQDQHFNLRRFEKWPRGDSDAELAAHALIEGDATFTMMAYVVRDLSRAQAFAKSMDADAGSAEQIKSAPRALRETLLFPYTQGMAYASQLFQRGGWARLTQAFTELPLSTEQILHPEKYFAHEAPAKVELANIAAALGAGWKRTDYDVNGEWGYYLILAEYLLAEVEAKQAAAGWGGDRYALYEEPKTGNLLITQLTTWDTEQDATEFFNAYAKRTVRRYNLGASVAGTTSSDGARQRWKTNQGTVVMERRGTRVMILEGLPDKANTEALVNASWQ